MDINTILWCTFLIALLFLVFKKNGTRKHKKLIGGALIFLGVLLLCPIPDPTDAVGFTLFSALKGIKLSVDNFIRYFIEYSIISFIIGIILIWAGINIAGLKPKHLMNKLKKMFN
jgi:formate hydrogenlyase subunit 3/multisubunit Na+/H+ antiporter MnhD subunit